MASSESMNGFQFDERDNSSRRPAMKSDREIEQDVRDELQWDPDLDASDIAMSVKNGVVTLAGFVKSYTDKYEAEAAVKRVAGVVGVANDLEVRLPSVDERPDPILPGMLSPRSKVSSRSRPSISRSLSKMGG
jgi:hypothetical protein